MQQLMLETSSNNDAWCWANMHMYRASCALLLHEARTKGLMVSPVAAQASPNAMQTTFDPVESDRRAAQPTDVPGGREGQPDAGPETEDRDAPPTWPAKTLQAIVRMFGDRAKNSSIRECQGFPLLFLYSLDFLASEFDVFWGRWLLGSLASLQRMPEGLRRMTGGLQPSLRFPTPTSLPTPVTLMY